MLNLENFPMLNSQNNMDDEALMDAYLDKIKHEYKDAWTEENWEEVIKSVTKLIFYSISYLSEFAFAQIRK